MIEHQIAVGKVTQKQQITGTKRMKHWQIDFFTRAPQPFYQRSGIQFTIKREKRGHGLRFHDGSEAHHACGCLLRGLCLLLVGKRFSA